MTGQDLLSTNHGVTGLIWIGGGKEGSYETEMQVFTRSLPCQRQLLLQNQ